MKFSARVVSVLGECLVTAGALVLLFVVWQAWWTDVTARAQSDRASERLEQRWKDPAVTESPLPAVPSGPRSATEGKPAGMEAPPVVASPPEVGTAFALVRIPAFGRDYVQPLLEGTDTQTLKSGVGHYVGTALPGAVGNLAIAGHRVTYGRPFFRIDELRVDDVVQVETERALLTYTVRSSLVVTPDRIDVIAPVPERPGEQPQERLLTLTACHPRYSARQRYIVQAVLTSWKAKTNESTTEEADTAPSAGLGPEA